jgi:hypothetical protein
MKIYMSEHIRLAEETEQKRTPAAETVILIRSIQHSPAEIGAPRTIHRRREPVIETGTG